MEFRKVETESFDSIIMSFATSLVKKGFEADKFEAVIEKDMMGFFYNVQYLAYSNEKCVCSSEAGVRTDLIRRFIDKENQEAGLCELNLYFKGKI